LRWSSIIPNAKERRYLDVDVFKAAGCALERSVEFVAVFPFCGSCEPDVPEEGCASPSTYELDCCSGTSTDEQAGGSS